MDVAGSPMRAGNGSADGAGCAADAPGYIPTKGEPMRERVPLAAGVSALGTDDVAASINGPNMRYARRFSLDVAEEALRDLGRKAIPMVAGRLAEQIAHEHHAEIQHVVHSYILDRAWAEPLIREEIRRTVRAVITEMLLPNDPT